MLLDLNAYSWPVFKKEINKLAVLALPMLVAQVAQVGIGFVDTVMAGGAGKDDLAAVALGSSVFATIYITFMGVMTALNPMIAQLFGAGKADEVGETGRQGIWFGVMLGIIGMLLMWLLVWPFQAWLSLSDKVENPEEMQQALAEFDFFGLSRLPSFEPKRGPFVPSYIATINTPLIYLPIEIGMTADLQAWMSALDGSNAESLATQFNQKLLRQWKRRHPGHRSFTVVRHPVARAHAIFCNKILGTGPGAFPKIRENLRRVYKLKIPRNGGADDYDCLQHRRVFLQYLSFLKSNLSGQTSIRVDAAWASQTEILQGFSQFSLPDMVLRAEQLQSGLIQLADQVACKAPPMPEAKEELPFRLAEIYDEELESAVRDVYQRDYMMLGFDAWRPQR